LVKCIADNAISWIYAPITKGHVDAEENDEVVVEGLAGREEVGNDVAGAGVDSDEIVIDIDIDDEMEDVPEPAPKADEQGQGYIEIEAFDADAFQESERRIESRHR